MPAPAAAHTLHFPIFWAGPEGVRACLLLGKKNLPQHLKAANTFSREFKSTFLPRLKPAAFPKERTKPSGLRHARGAAEGGREVQGSNRLRNRDSGAELGTDRFPARA